MQILFRSFHDGLQTVALKEINRVLRSEVVERRIDEIRIGADVLRELVPVLQIGEVAPSLAREQDFPARPGHLLKYCDPVSYTHLDVYKRQKSPSSHFLAFSL